MILPDGPSNGIMPVRAATDCAYVIDQVVVAHTGMAAPLLASAEIKERYWVL